MEQAIASVQTWVNEMIIDLNLCPFASRVVGDGRVRVVATDAATETALLERLYLELEHLQQTDEIETTLLVHPRVLEQFPDYNQFLDQVDLLLRQGGFEGEFQVASFHPRYQFAGTLADDPENYAGRSPYPLLHILREASIEQAVQQHPDTEAIPARNIEVLNNLGYNALASRWQACFVGVSGSDPDG